MVHTSKNKFSATKLTFCRLTLLLTIAGMVKSLYQSRRWRSSRKNPRRWIKGNILLINRNFWDLKKCAPPSVCLLLEVRLLPWSSSSWCEERRLRDDFWISGELLLSSTIVRVFVYAVLLITWITYWIKPAEENLNYTGKTSWTFLHYQVQLISDTDILKPDNNL